jgi:hypothetical protein
MSMALRWLPGRFGVYRLAPDAPLPAWATLGAFSTVSRSDTELSVLCAWRDGVTDLPVIGPLACAVVEGPLDFALTGILASLTAPLAGAGISVFSVATYDTDYLLVAEEEAPRAQAVLETAGHRFPERGPGPAHG